MQALRKVVTALRNYKTDFASSRLIVVGSDIALVEDHKRVTMLLKSADQCGFAFICDGPETIQFVSDKIEKLAVAA